jgi:hypothetical protein
MINPGLTKVAHPEPSPRLDPPPLEYPTLDPVIVEVIEGAPLLAPKLQPPDVALNIVVVPLIEMLVGSYGLKLQLPLNSETPPPPDPALPSNPVVA